MNSLHLPLREGFNELDSTIDRSSGLDGSVLIGSIKDEETIIGSVCASVSVETTDFSREL